ncbi:TetR/AcrR family transcriptional regulator [Streptosporangium sp. G11]|uniref:TetR/AcrR family transcriptional regulator n=1 Tax=Streptosporangium sp. G11 TaxID=3436926 RepID=UPI003EBA84F5
MARKAEVVQANLRGRAGETRGLGSPARQRLLQTATRLFYAEGIHMVGVDRLAAEAKVTKATFYRHFPAKDDLVRAYLEEHDQRIRVTVDALAGRAGSASEVLTALVTGIEQRIQSPGFRGCAFLNAAAEYPDHDHPVRLVVAAHRRWFRLFLTQLLRNSRHPRPEPAAATLMLLLDGAMSAGHVDDPPARWTASRAGSTWCSPTS